jgi:uncharacterized protein DUF1634
MSETARVKVTPVRTKGEGLVGRAVNVGGVAGAALLMIVALARAHSAHLPETAYPFAIGRLRDDLAEGSPIALAMAACVVLVLTPTARMLVLTIYLGAQKRWVFACAALVVVGILTAAFAIA